MKRVLFLLASLVFAFPAQADWYAAESDHFVVYADDRWQDVQEFGEALERYHAALNVLNLREDTKPSPSNRVTIFVVGSEHKVRKLLGEGAKNVAGFYFSRAGASRAFVPDIRMHKRRTDFSVTILLHEYAHHYLMSNSPYALPRWVNEGAAEFYASAKFEKDGGISIGGPASHRAGELFHAKDVSVRELIDPELYRKNRSKRYDAFYGRAWLLYHYLYFAEDRRGQLGQYLVAIARGTDQVEAANRAFGDFDELQKDLDRYLRQRRMKVWNLGADALQTAPVRVRELSEGEGEVMPFRIRLQRGVTREEALELLPDVREVADEFPDDPAVLATLAEAEFDAGNYDRAIVAADAALAIDPAVKNALIQKGYALFAKAEDAEDPDAAYGAAMQPFSVLNRLEQDHPIPLIYYYRSFAERGVEPNETARHALERASQLALFDRGLAMNKGLMQASEGKIAIARSSLAPVAANPHGGELAKVAQRYLDQLAKVAEGTRWHPGPTIDPTATLKAIANDIADDTDDEDEGGERASS
tara:strand:- start:9 stop:1601 length:1593 start_codon:yes stop_codon:yes gene_type:complete